jgi:phage shock protein A
MIFGKFWRTIMAQVNKLANLFWTSDPIAQMQYEYDMAVDQLKTGREGLEQYQALVQRVARQVAADQSHVSKLEAQIKAYLLANDRDTAAKFALELQRAKKDLEENQGQLKMHEESYNNNVMKIKHAMKKLGEIKTKIAKYDAELKMSRAEAEMAKLATEFNFDITTDFGQIEEVIQDKIGLNRAKAKVAADLSGQGLEDIKREQAVEKALADDALKQFEIELGMAAPETAKVGESSKELGPTVKVREQ